MSAIRRRNLPMLLLLGVYLSCMMFVLIKLNSKRPIPINEDTPLGKTLLTVLEQSTRNGLCKRSDGFTRQQIHRYSDFIKRFEDEDIVIAMNLHDNQAILPDFIVQLGVLFDMMPKTRFFVSVFESGSSDQTRIYLKIMEFILNEIGVNKTIQTGTEHLEPDIHRIEFLASMRNRVLEQALDSGIQFSKVVFMNDVFWCFDDVIELMFQSEHQDADLACALDYDVDEHGLGFYDKWVARDIQGRKFEKRPLDQFTTHQPTNDRIKQNVPFQVGCCWNGIAVLNAKPFLEGLRFRKASSELSDGQDKVTQRLQQENMFQIVYSECGGSEMNTLCKDLYRRGYTKFIVVPRVKVAYDYFTYNAIRKNAYPFEQSFAAEESQKVEYSPLPESMFCHPLEGYGARDPDGIPGEELWRIE